jgi:hypothetical protein
MPASSLSALKRSDASPLEFPLGVQKMLREISGPVRPAIKCGAHVHKELGMVDVRNVKCDVAGCDKQPYFNFPDVRPAIKCGAHKESGMVDAFGSCEVRCGFEKKSRFQVVRCSFPRCNVTAMISWLDALGPARFATFVCGSVAARLVDPAFTVALNRWLDALGPARFATLCFQGSRLILLHTSFSTPACTSNTFCAGRQCCTA